jgi:hypothetical protein
MSSTSTRRMKRKKEQDIKKGIYKPERELNIPTEQELEEYISNKSKELRMNDKFPHKELMEWKNEEHLKLMKNEQVK